MNQPAPQLPANFGPKWPKVIGIISIVLAVLSFFGAVSSFFTPKMLRFQVSMGQFKGSMEDFDAFLAKYHWYFLLGACVALVSGILLISGGISLLRSKKAGKTLLLAYALITLLFASFSIYMTLGSSMLSEQMTAMFGSAQDSPEAAAGRIGGLIGGIIGTAFSMAYPVFLLIWFSRGAVKNDIRNYFS